MTAPERKPAVTSDQPSAALIRRVCDLELAVAELLHAMRGVGGWGVLRRSPTATRIAEIAELLRTKEGLVR
jgi:DNA-binding IscR family transcriptional regulator